MTTFFKPNARIERDIPAQGSAAAIPAGTLVKATLAKDTKKCWVQAAFGGKRRLVSLTHVTINHRYSDFAAAGRSLDWRKRSSLIKFLVEHERHADYNDPFLFSHNVKLHSFGLYGELLTKAYDVYAYMRDSQDYDWATSLFEEFAARWGASSGITPGWAGRSSGHIALYGVLSEVTQAEYEDVNLWTVADLRQMAKLVIAFDQLCDDLVAEFFEIVEAYEFVGMNEDEE